MPLGLIPLPFSYLKPSPPTTTYTQSKSQEQQQREDGNNTHAVSSAPPPALPRVTVTVRVPLSEGGRDLWEEEVAWPLTARHCPEPEAYVYMLVVCMYVCMCAYVCVIVSSLVIEPDPYV